MLEVNGLNKFPNRIYYYHTRRLVPVVVTPQPSTGANDHPLRRYHTPSLAAGLVPTADATLINGKGRYAAGPTTPLAVIYVIKGLRYRFRLVSISCDPNYKFSIDGHTMVHKPRCSMIIYDCLLGDSSDYHRS
jgi:Multicopper oxidase